VHTHIIDGWMTIAWSALAQAEEAGAPVEGAADAAPQAALQVQSVWDFIIKGGPVMIPIIACSLIAFAVFAERMIALRKRGVIPARVADGVVERYREGGKPAALALLRDRNSPASRVLQAAIKRIGEPAEAMERHVQEAGEREAFGLRKRLRVLAVIGGIAPLLGLLGTIFGMINAFQTVAISPDALGKTELLAEGIYQAMITTAAGLIVAIPVVIAHHWLAARIDWLVMEIDRVTVDFVESLDGDALPAKAATQNGDGAARPATPVMQPAASA
jgi:biopolymer transport protein ExbB